MAEIVVVAASVIGTLVAVESARQQKKAAEKNAERAEQEARASEQRLRRDRALQLARARAQFGLSGFDFSGSVFDVLADEAMRIEEDALLVRSGGLARSARFQNEAQAAENRAVGTLLAGAGDVAGEVRRQQAFNETGDTGLIT